MTTDRLAALTSSAIYSQGSFRAASEPAPAPYRSALAILEHGTRVDGVFVADWRIEVTFWGRSITPTGYQSRTAEEHVDDVRAQYKRHLIRADVRLVRLAVDAAAQV